MKTSALQASVLLCGIAIFGLARGDGAGIRVHNQTSTTVTVKTDSGYGCTADSGDTCSFAASQGQQKLNAKRHDNGRVRIETINLTSQGYDFNLSDGSP